MQAGECSAQPHVRRACRLGCRYQTYDELYGYCYKVAGTVALMTTPVMGINPAYSVRTCSCREPNASCQNMRQGLRGRVRVADRTESLELFHRSKT